VGADFFASALNGNLNVAGGAVGSAGYVYFSALAVHATGLVVLFAIVFIGWFLPALYVNAAMPHRALLVWSLDGLLPRKLGEVDPRTHTPLWSILVTLVIGAAGAVWISYSSSFFEYFAVTTLFNYPTIVLVGISALLVKRRRPEMYRNSGAEWRICGVEVLPFVGCGCVLVGVGAFVLALWFATPLGITRPVATALGPFVVFAISAVWWWSARRVQRRRGIDLDIVYAAIPPE
jgi:basic amino acid/polyamine antiporter, APA family